MLRHSTFKQEFAKDAEALLRQVFLSVEDGTEKQKIVVASWVRELLRKCGLAICDPRTSEPCRLYAIGNHTIEGRYYLAGRSTKRYSGNYKTVAQLAPDLHLVVDEPRIEALSHRYAQQKRGRGGEDTPSL